MSYGGETGFNQAIELSSETLGNVKLIQVHRRRLWGTATLLSLCSSAIKEDSLFNHWPLSGVFNGDLMLTIFSSITLFGATQEKKLIQKWFDEIAQDTGKYCFMIKDTINALEQVTKQRNRYFIRASSKL